MTRRNPLMLLLAVELMLNAANVALVGFSPLLERHERPDLRADRDGRRRRRGRHRPGPRGVGLPPARRPRRRRDVGASRLMGTLGWIVLGLPLLGSAHPGPASAPAEPPKSAHPPRRLRLHRPRVRPDRWRSSSDGRRKPRGARPRVAPVGVDRHRQPQGRPGDPHRPAVGDDDAGHHRRGLSRSTSTRSSTWTTRPATAASSRR